MYRLPAPQAVAVDALSIPWDKWSVYCPSTNSVNAVSTSQVGSLKSVSNASNGSTSASPVVGSILLSLLVDFQREVPPFPRLLKQPQSGAFQPTRTCSTVYMELSVVFESNGFPVFLSQVGCLPLRATDSYYYRFVSCLHILSLDPDSQQSDLSGSLRFGRQVADVTIFTNP